MRNKTKTLFIGGAFACIGSLSGHGETFQEKLDAYFAEHREEIQESIREWDVYNLNKPEYHITEQELKDVVMRSYKKTIDWMKLSMQHQIRFFGYYTKHLCEGDMASLKKRFDGKQIRIRALQELDDMIEKFSAKGIYFSKLVQYNQPIPYASFKLEEYKKACVSWNPDAKDPKTLEKLLQDTVESRCTFIENLTCGDHPALYDEDVRYAVNRINWFFCKILTDYPRSLHWTDLAVPEKQARNEIVSIFRDGYATYTKWNKLAYHLSKNKVCVTFPYPDYPLSINYGMKGICDGIFEDDDLVKAYCRIALLLQECINDACRLYRMYMDTLAKLSEVRGVRLKKIQDWYGKVLKRCKALSRYWEVQHYMPTIAVAYSRNDFETVAEALGGIRGCLQKLHEEIRNQITQ